MVLCIQETPPSVPLWGDYCAGSILAAGRGSHAGRAEVGEGRPDGGVACTSTFEALNRAEDFSVRLRTTETVTTKP